MGRHGPLTSQALGRSPYDDVVQGEGEIDPRAPFMMWDERGRPVNPETKRINRDIIRSHNEVMSVIGVAEPDNDTSETQTDVIRKHDEYEDRIGYSLQLFGRLVETAGTRGVNGMRYRILLYRRYSHIPFHCLFSYERSRRSLGASLFAGFPSMLVEDCLGIAQLRFGLEKSSSLEWVNRWVRLHLRVFSTLQQLGVISASRWFPDPMFFIPCSSSSPIPPPPPITSFTISEMARWAGTLALNAAPLAALYLAQRIWHAVDLVVGVSLYSLMPKPYNADKHDRQTLEDSSHMPEPPRPAAAPQPPPEEQPRNGRDISRDEVTFRALEGQPPNDRVPVGAVRRQSTVSARPDEYASEDEEAEVISATLISFDVEASEPTDIPAGIWSAELRPNVAEGRPTENHEPSYRDNALTNLPALTAADALASFPARLITAASEAVVWRFFVRSFLTHRGAGLGDIYGLGVIENFSWTAFVNFLGVELVHLMLRGEIWATMTLVARHFSMSEEEWQDRYWSLSIADDD